MFPYETRSHFPFPSVSNLSYPSQHPASHSELPMASIRRQTRPFLTPPSPAELLSSPTSPDRHFLYLRCPPHHTPSPQKSLGSIPNTPGFRLTGNALRTLSPTRAADPYEPPGTSTVISVRTRGGSEDDGARTTARTQAGAMHCSMFYPALHTYALRCNVLRR